MVSNANGFTSTLSTNFNVSPYYDDFNEEKNFHRIIFRPGLAVQARELTQMQTIIQNQIDRFASHIFQEGATVTGFEMNLDVFYHYVKLLILQAAIVILPITKFLLMLLVVGFQLIQLHLLMVQLVMVLLLHSTQALSLLRITSFVFQHRLLFFPSIVTSHLFV